MSVFEIGDSHSDEEKAEPHPDVSKIDHFKISKAILEHLEDQIVVPAEGRLSEFTAVGELSMSVTIITITIITTLKITAGLGKTAQDRVVESGFRAAD